MFDESRIAAGAEHTTPGRMTRKSLLKAGGSLAALASPLGMHGLALARASEKLARQPLSTQPINLRFLTRAGPGYNAFFRAAGAAFTKMHPNVSIQYEEHDNDFATKLKVEIAGSNPPDLVFHSDDLVNSFAARGALTDLAPFFKAAGLKKADFWPEAIDPQFLGQHLFGMPLDYGMHVVFYNKALFDRQHLRYPTSSWTYSDFVRIARELTIDRSGKRASEAGFQPEFITQYAENGNIQFFWQDVVNAFGGDWTNSNLTKATLNTPPATAAFQFLADLVNKYHVSTPPSKTTSQTFLLEHGNVAMFFDGTWDFSVYPHTPLLKWNQGNVDIVLFPRQKVQVPIAEASQICILSGIKAQNVKWAWEYLKFMTTEQGQRMAFSYGVATIPNSPTLTKELLPTYKQPKNAGLLIEYLPKATKGYYYTEAISDQQMETLFLNPWSPTPEMADLYYGRKKATQVMPSVNAKLQQLLNTDQALAKKFGATLHHQ